MSQLIQAIFEHGVFRPLEPVTFAEHERVTLSVSEATASKSSDEDVIRKQPEALARLRAEMDSLLNEAPQDGLRGADHDVILYGLEK